MGVRALIGHDNYGNTWGPLDPKAPRRSLLGAMGRRSAAPMYVDLKSGGTRHVGYVVSGERGAHDAACWVELHWETVEAWNGPAGSKAGG